MQIHNSIRLLRSDKMKEFPESLQSFFKYDGFINIRIVPEYEKIFNVGQNVNPAVQILFNEMEQGSGYKSITDPVKSYEKNF